MSHPIDGQGNGFRFAPTDRLDIGATVTNVKNDTQRAVKDLQSLAQAEIKPIAKNAGIGGGMFGAAGYFGLNAVSLLFMAGGFGFATIFVKAAGWGIVPSLALGFVCMAVLLLILAGVLAMLGKKSIDKVGPPKKTIDEAKATVAAFTQSVKKGQNAVTANSLERKALSAEKKQAKDLDRIG